MTASLKQATLRKPVACESRYPMSKSPTVVWEHSGSFDGDSLPAFVLFRVHTSSNSLEIRVVPLAADGTVLPVLRLREVGSSLTAENLSCTAGDVRCWIAAHLKVPLERVRLLAPPDKALRLPQGSTRGVYESSHQKPSEAEAKEQAARLAADDIKYCEELVADADAPLWWVGRAPTGGGWSAAREPQTWRADPESIAFRVGAPAKPLSLWPQGPIAMGADVPDDTLLVDCALMRMRDQ